MWGAIGANVWCVGSMDLRTRRCFNRDVVVELNAWMLMRVAVLFEMLYCVGPMDLSVG